MTDLEKLKTMVGALLAGELPTRETIRERIREGRSLCSGVTDEQAEELALWFESVHGVAMQLGAALQDRGFEPWLEDARAGIDPYYWDRYRQLLVQREFSGQVLATLDSVTDRVLGLLENPAREGQWDRRGMVMGHVQSGKTANYTGWPARPPTPDTRSSSSSRAFTTTCGTRRSAGSTRGSSGSTARGA